MKIALIWPNFNIWQHDSVLSVRSRFSDNWASSSEISIFRSDMRIQKFIISFDNANAVYRQGESVSGKVFLSLEKTLKLKGLCSETLFLFFPLLVSLILLFRHQASNSWWNSRSLGIWEKEGPKTEFEPYFCITWGVLQFQTNLTWKG